MTATAPEKSTKNFSIRLNSEGLCFICLKDTKANGGNHAPPTSFRLRNIARFLGIDTKKILKAYLDYDLKKCSDVKVELCEGCLEQVHKFNCLYQTLELTKLKLNECAQKISSLIKEAEQECDDDDDRTGEMERRVTHAATKGVIVDLRAGISEKCLEFSGTVPPRLILERLPESELAKILCRNGEATSSHTTTPVKTEVPDEDDESWSPMDNFTAASEISDSDTESVISQKKRRIQIKARLRKSYPLDGKFTEKASNHQGMTPATSNSGLETSPSISQSPDGTRRASCPHCRAVYANQPACHLKRLLDTHLSIFHLHTFLHEEDLKEPALSSYQFQQVIHHHLFANISTDPRNPNLFKCPNCSVTMAKDKISPLRLHVIKSHYESVVQRVKKLQVNPMILKKLSKTSEVFICKCGVCCSNKKLYNLHRLKFCKLVEKTPTPTNAEMSPKLSSSEAVYQQIKPSISKSADGTEQLSCPHCRAVITTKLVRQVHRILREHLVCHHLHTFFPQDKHKKPSLTSYQFKQVIHHFLFENVAKNLDPEKKEASLQCPYCNVTRVNCGASRLKLHLIKFHYLSLVQRLEELQKDELIFEKLAKIRKAFPCKCGDYFMSIKLFKLHRKKFCNLNGDHVGTGSSRETDSSACKTERDPLDSEDEETFQAGDNLSDSEDLNSIDIGDVKPCIDILFAEEKESEQEEPAGTVGSKKRLRASSDSGSDESPTDDETEGGVPQKTVKLN